MASIGMIFQLNADEGQLMFDQGEKRSFEMSAWVDSLNEPAIGQKVSCEYTANGLEIKAVSIDEAVTAAFEEVELSSSAGGSSVIDGLNTIDDYIEYFTGRGFKCAKDMQVGEKRTLSFRKLENGDPVEVIVTEDGKGICAAKTVNGRPMPLE